jgi:hypothetical protein
MVDLAGLPSNQCAIRFCAECHLLFFSPFLMFVSPLEGFSQAMQ